MTDSVNEQGTDANEGNEFVEDSNQAQEPQHNPLAEMEALLKDHNVASPDDFTKLVEDLNNYKKGYGQSQNHLGELRREIEELRLQMQSSSKQPAEFDEYGEPKPVNLRAEMKAVLSEYAQEQAQYQQRAQNYYTQERAKVESQRNWKNVQPHFDKALLDPNIQNAVRNGMSFTDLYYRINESLLLSTVDSAMKQLPQGVRQTPVTDASGRVAQKPNSNQQRAQQIRRSIETLDTPGVLENLIPDNDPLLRY